MNETKIADIKRRLDARLVASPGIHKPERAKAAEWSDPRPLPTLPQVPAFPLAILPEALAPWVADLAERARFPVDFAAVTAMSALGSVIGRKLGIRLKARDDWTEYANLWGCLVGLPGGTALDAQKPSDTRCAGTAQASTSRGGRPPCR